ncbi:unnamed protein product, partial [Lymnaea stagnalis]
SFQAVPVASWGRRYFAVTLFDFPSIQITSDGDRNLVRIRFRFHGTRSPTLTYSNVEYAPDKTLHVELDRGGSFSIHHCDKVKEKHNGSLTGSSVVGQFPIGVISGNCDTATYTTNCRNYRLDRWGSTADVVTEMLLPVEAYGTEFIVVSFNKRSPHGVLMIVASENDTEVSIFLTSDGRTKNITLIHAGDLNKEVIIDDHRMVLSDKKIQVVMMSRSACWSSEGLEHQGDSSISLLIPNYLFYVEYFWITPNITPDSYAALVSENDKIEYLVFDLEPVPDTSTWEEVTGPTSYIVTSVRASTGSHSAASTHYFKFGCYLVGITHKAEYMYPAGF